MEQVSEEKAREASPAGVQGLVSDKRKDSPLTEIGG